MSLFVCVFIFSCNGLGALASLVLDRRAGRDTSAGVLRLAFIVFALALLGKIVFNVRLHHYGFALALPGTVVLLARQAFAFRIADAGDDVPPLAL